MVKVEHNINKLKEMANGLIDDNDWYNWSVGGNNREIMNIDRAMDDEKLIFTIEGKELKSAKKWIKKQKKKNKKVGTIGDRFVYEFSITGIGIGKSVRDCLTGKSKNITDYDKW